MSLRQAAKNESIRLSQYADEDIAAYRAYLEARRLKVADHASALRGAIQGPFKAAQSALAGLDLCADAATMVHGAVGADLATAAILLEGSIRAMLLSVEVNLQQLPDCETSAQCKEMKEKTLRQLASVLRKVTPFSAAEQTTGHDAA